MWTFRDFFNEILVPIIFGITIILMATVVRDALRPSHPWEDIITFGFIENILVIGLPVLLGIGYNRWAGGGAGFILTLLYLLTMQAIYPGSSFDRSYVGLITANMLTGYLAGALNRGSESIKRCISSALIAAWSMSFIAFFMYMAYSPMYSPNIYLPLLGWGGKLSNDFQLYMNAYFIVRGIWALEGAVFGRILLMMKPMYAAGMPPPHAGA